MSYWDMETEFLRFVKVESKTKTHVFSVIGKQYGDTLGIVKWHNAWRHYCFFPTCCYETVYSDRCLETIAKFVRLCNEQQRKKALTDESQCPQCRRRKYNPDCQYCNENRYLPLNNAFGLEEKK